MTLTLVGSMPALLGVILTIWSILYARKQSEKLSDVQRNEMISLWAHLDRICTLITQIEKITDDNGYISSGSSSPYHQQILPQIFKGLCNEYVRTVELVVKETPNITIVDVEEWETQGKLKTDWQNNSL